MFNYHFTAWQSALKRRNSRAVIHGLCAQPITIARKRRKSRLTRLEIAVIWDQGERQPVEADMTDQTTAARIRATLEDELAECAPLAHLSTEKIEEIALRLTRAIEPLIGGTETGREAHAA